MNPCKNCNKHIPLSSKYHQPIYGLICDKCVSDYGYFYVIMYHVDYEGDGILGVYLDINKAKEKLKQVKGTGDYEDIEVFDKDGNHLGNIWEC